MKFIEDNLKEAWTTTPTEAQAWAQLRDNLIPAMTGSPEWLAWMGFLEGKLLEFGVVDVHKNRWPFTRWETSDDPSRWSLHIDGRALRVAFYGANSGSTAAEGLARELIYYDHLDPPESIEGKIAVIPSRPHPNPSDPDFGAYSVDNTFNDYEYRSSEGTYPPLYEIVDPQRIPLASIPATSCANDCIKLPSMATRPEPSLFMTWLMSAPKGCIAFQCPTIMSVPH